MRENAPIMEALQGIIQILGRMESRIGTMETRIIAADKNNIARVCNSRLSRDGAELAPLVNATTNVDIPDFPRTIRDMSALQLEALTIIIRALGGNGAGTAENKRKEVRMLCGLTPVAV